MQEPVISGPRSGAGHAFGDSAMRTSSLLLFSALFGLAACGGAVRNDDLFSGGGGESNSSSGSSSSGSSGGSSGAIGTCGAVPVCEPGDTEVSSESECLQDDAYCYSRSLCGMTIWCTGTIRQCKARPICPPGTYQVDTCVTKQCTSVTKCGITIQCDVTCEGPPPTCDTLDVEVPGPEYCLNECYSRTNRCGLVIWCTDSGLPPFDP